MLLCMLKIVEEMATFAITIVAIKKVKQLLDNINNEERKKGG